MYLDIRTINVLDCIEFMTLDLKKSFPSSLAYRFLRWRLSYISGHGKVGLEQNTCGSRREKSGVHFLNTC